MMTGGTAGTRETGKVWIKRIEPSFQLAIQNVQAGIFFRKISVLANKKNINFKLKNLIPLR